MTLFALQVAADSTRQAATNFTASGSAQMLSALVDRVLDYAVLLAAVGAVAMALLEAIKKLVDFRAKFHADEWTEFMKSNGYVESPQQPHEDAFVQLLQLSCGVNEQEAHVAVLELTKSDKPRAAPRIGWREARDMEAKNRTTKRAWIPTLWGQPKAAYSVFAQPTERMAATLGDAADVALASPKTYESLFTFLVRGAEPKDIETWTNAKDSSAPAAARVTAEEKRKRAEAARESAGALSRLRLVARRKIAAFQLFTEQSWASWNQLAANFLGVIIMGIVLFELRRPPLELVVGSLLGGVLSPVAKDLVSALQRAKGDLKPTSE